MISFHSYGFKVRRQLNRPAGQPIRTIYRITIVICALIWGSAPAYSAKQPRLGTLQNPVVVQPLSEQLGPERIQQLESDRAAHNINEAALVRWTQRLTNATLLMAVVALGQLCMFIWQLRLMRGGARDTRLAAEAASATSLTMANTAEKQLRAYVGVQKAFMEVRRLATGTKILARITVVNAGQTTAFEARLAIHIGVFDSQQLEQDMRFREGTTYLVPGFEWEAQQVTVEDFTEEQLQSLAKRDRYLILWGEVRYKDAFSSEPRHSRFCFRQGAVMYNDPTLQILGWNVYPAESGNHAT